MSKYAELYRGFFQTIGRPLTAKDGVNPELWQTSEVAVPASIAQFYEVAGNATDFTQVYDWFLSPDEWEQEDGMSVIISENQGVMLWAYRHDDQHVDDPEVYYALAEDRDWKALEIVWSEYFLHMLCMQVHQSEEKQKTMPFIETAVLEEGMAERVALTWKKIGQAYDDELSYIRPNCILTQHHYDGDYRVFVGAQSAQLIEEVGEEFGFEWDGDGLIYWTDEE